MAPKRYELSDAQWERIACCCPTRWAIRAGPVRITACSYAVVSGFCARTRIGAICRSVTGSGRPCVTASVTGAMPGPGSRCSGSRQRAKETGEDGRIALIQSDIWIAFPRAEQVLDRLQSLIEAPRQIRMPGLLVHGASGIGKTMIARNLSRRYLCRGTQEHSRGSSIRTAELQAEGPAVLPGGNCRGPEAPVGQSGDAQRCRRRLLQGRLAAGLSDGAPLDRSSRPHCGGGSRKGQVSRD